LTKQEILIAYTDYETALIAVYFTNRIKIIIIILPGVFDVTRSGGVSRGLGLLNNKKQ